MKELTSFEVSKCTGGDNISISRDGYVCYPFCACSDGETNKKFRSGSFQPLRIESFNTYEIESMQKICESIAMTDDGYFKFENITNVTCKVIVDDTGFGFCDAKPI